MNKNLQNKFSVSPNLGFETVAELAHFFDFEKSAKFPHRRGFETTGQLVTFTRGFVTARFAIFTPTLTTLRAGFRSFVLFVVRLITVLVRSGTLFQHHTDIIHWNRKTLNKI